MEFGIGMNGLEQRLEEITKSVTDTFDSVTYVEIGVAEATTLTTIAYILSQHTARWRAVGVELPNGYSFSRSKSVENAAKRNLLLSFITPNGNIQHPRWNEVSVYLKDSQTFLTEMWQEPIQFALIDGCHGKPCVIQDFLAVEAWLDKDGVVMFHDFCTRAIGIAQPHCAGGIDVKGACRDLGLLTNRRKGWKFVETIGADAAAGGWDMGVFKKETAFEQPVIHPEMRAALEEFCNNKG